MLSEYNAGYVLGQRQTADLERELELRRRIAERASLDDTVEKPVREPWHVRLHNPFGAEHRMLTLH